jgi:hypothetical protein
MARITEEQGLSLAQDVWIVDLHESEREWGSESWSEFFTTFVEANERYTTVNAVNPADHVPDYYIVASKPRKAIPRLT